MSERVVDQLALDVEAEVEVERVHHADELAGDRVVVGVAHGAAEPDAGHGLRGRVPGAGRQGGVAAFGAQAAELVLVGRGQVQVGRGDVAVDELGAEVARVVEVARHEVPAGCRSESLTGVL